MIVYNIQNKNDNRFKSDRNSNNSIKGILNPTKWSKISFVKSFKGN